MLRVVHTAPWDWEPPHMSGYPHLPSPPPQYPPPHAHRQPQHSYHQDPQWHPSPPLPPPPPASAAWRAAPPPPPPQLLRPMARPPSQRPSHRSFNRRSCLARSPMWHRSRRCVGGCGPNAIVRPPLRLSMRGLYGAVSHMYVDPRSRLPNVLHLGCPPCVSTGSAGDRRDAGQSAPSRNGRN